MERSDADVAVIGAGVMGCAIAYELSRLGYDALVLERNLGAGTGSTGASSAIIRFNYSQISTVAAAWESVHRWRAWSDYLGAPQDEPLAGFVRTGGLNLPAPVQDVDLVLRHFDAIGIPYERLECRPDQARAPVGRPEAPLSPSRSTARTSGRSPTGTSCRASGCRTRATSTTLGWRRRT